MPEEINLSREKVYFSSQVEKFQSRTDRFNSFGPMGDYVVELNSLLREAKWARGRGSIRNNARGRTSATKSPSSSLLSFKYITASQHLLSWNQSLNTRAVRKHQDAISIVVQTPRVERAGPCQLDTVSYRPRLCVCLGRPWVSKPELYYL